METEQNKEKILFDYIGAGQKIHSSFSLPSYRKTQMNFLAKPKSTVHN